jgi:hypothetical protein
MGALRFRCRVGAGAIVAFVSALMNPSAYGQPSIAHVPAVVALLSVQDMAGMRLGNGATSLLKRLHASVYHRHGSSR